MQADRALGKPQWSPPLDGGSTVVPEKQDVIGLVAAMEPACDPREHQYLPRVRA